MNRLLDTFFDLGAIPDGATGLELTWARPMPGWAWFIAIILAVTFATWSYSRLQGPGWGRGILATLRAIVILLVIAIIAGPQIRYPREDVEQDIVMVLLDRSASMEIKDAEVDSTRMSRDDQLDRILLESADTWSTLGERSELRWMGFGSGSYPLITSTDEQVPSLEEPIGWRTDISASLQQALDGVASRPLSGLVIFSDGRSMSQPARTIIRRLQQDSIPIFTVPLGSPDPVLDVSINEVSAPRRAFVTDAIPVLVDLDSSGLPDEEMVVVRLRDEQTGQVLDRKTVEINDDLDGILMTANLEDPGDRTLVVDVETSVGDLIAENDSMIFEVEVVDRPIRVLYIEGYPRWEYRYLKNLLVREQSIESSVMLISADRDFAQEGNTPISRLPRTAEEFEQFDLILIGDVPSGFFSPEQLRLMSNQVAERGTGLFWIGGPRDTPSSWAGSPLDDLLPIRSPLDLDRTDDSVLVAPTPLSRQLGVLVLDPSDPSGWAMELSDSSTGWSRLRSVQNIEPNQIKPTTEVLATGTDIDGETRPVLLSMRFGAGQVLYSAMDDVWRWRFGRGELLTERWWIGLVRMLARQALDTSGKSMELSIQPDEIIPGTAVRIQLSVMDERLASTLGDSISLEIEDENEQSSTELELLRSGDSAEWSADWFPDRIGQYQLDISDPLLVAESRSMGPSSVDVIRPDDEFRNPDADHQLLAELAESTGGSVLDPESLDSLPSVLPNREVLVENPIIIPIWNTGAVFFLVLGFLSAEWIGRRLIRMI
ncbi:MAG: VWA domain-containing protein [Phycisphaerales bacterium]|nr:VWA domain-containing protein [Phycisphaerales bacterium]